MILGELSELNTQQVLNFKVLSLRGRDTPVILA